LEDLECDLAWTFTSHGLTLTSVVPNNNAPNVVLDSEVFATFNDEVIENDLSGITINETLAEVTFDENVLTITHEPFAYSSDYTVTIPAGTLKGQTQAVEWTFQTVRGSRIEEINASSKIYPTVSAGTLTITTEKAATVKVTDVTGRSLAAYKSNGNLDINLNYANGVYFIVIDESGVVSTQKVVLKK
jgi:hypothetical protein